ncbi:hypothetical protein F2P45_29020 [Massilia sp. CCM 8733]|uniref:Uncharacterized protein n=1 Tax=Massilia mucilaginosa TaxID=2609282 RepID=A0ABX0P242_9BURK|nr:hypothetical protein [Massilia mucilaginosa]NHZ93019.1 hypothetical protein [Massilia mucilaginosa]
MNSGIPVMVPARAALSAVFGPIDDLNEALGAHAMKEEEMLALFVEGDWSCTGAGPMHMEELFAELVAQAPADKIVCAVVITGNLDAPAAILVDRDTDWAPALIVGGKLVAHSLCLGGGATQIVGDLAVHATVYGKYNHGSLEVGGDTRADTIFSCDFDMTFHGEVACPHVISALGHMNIPAHFSGAAIGRILAPRFVDDDGDPIDERILDAVNDGLSLLR